MKGKIKVVKLIPQEIEIEVELLSYMQENYVEVIEDYKRKHSKVPTMRKIGELMGGLQASGVCQMLERLKNKGYDYSEVKYDKHE